MSKRRRRLPLQCTFTTPRSDRPNSLPTHNQYFAGLGVAAILMSIVPLWLIWGGNFAEGLFIGIPCIFVLAAVAVPAWALLEK